MRRTVADWNGRPLSSVSAVAFWAKCTLIPVRGEGGFRFSLTGAALRSTMLGGQRRMTAFRSVGIVA
jgi:hypothetical protein